MSGPLCPAKPANPACSSSVAGTPGVDGHPENIPKLQVPHVLWDHVLWHGLISRHGPAAGRGRLLFQQWPGSEEEIRKPI